ncbi:putative carbonic anhydrase [Medicago truncatula]|uniref:Putative carbonic anhydrase n=1 Tax=Medicago truncatula TaxID=3880 RepID=A0A396JMP0_MEDTR|nr:putative carbonic anhydrase [Medicago truncatula]
MNLKLKSHYIFLKKLKIKSHYFLTFLGGLIWTLIFVQIILTSRHNAELHLVHFTEDNNNIAVVAQLYRLGVPDPLISKIEDKFYKLVNENHAGNKNANIALGTFDVNELNKKIYRYYRYVGSLTTPPCKEGVIWNVIGKVRTLSKKQLELLKVPLGVEFQHNARPLQPLNGCKIEMYNYHT